VSRRASEQREFAPWPDERLVLDSVDDLRPNIAAALAYVQNGRFGERVAR
jgi:hypothetical protein